MNYNSTRGRNVLLASTLVLLLVFAAYSMLAGTDSTNDPATTPVATVSLSMKHVRMIDQLEAHVRKSPGDVQSRISLAQMYLQEAQTSLQEAYYLPKAQAEIDNVLAGDVDNYEALALQASLYNTLHQFEKARELAASLVERSEKAHVYGILVDALVELGHYDEAVAACDKMISLRPGIASYSRAAYLRELHGDTAGAFEAMQLAAQAGVSGEMDRSWALYHLGQLYLGKNDLETAALIFDGILDETPYYAYAIGGMGQVALQRGDLDGAVILFQEAYSFVPSETFLEGMIEAQTLLGNESRVAELVELVKAGFVAADKMGENVRMEYADFLADHNMNLKVALEMAKLEYQRRPNHLHALETYAWTLHKNGRSTEAIPYIEQAMRLETGDAMVHYRAGHIYQDAGLADEADHNFKVALASNLHIESPATAASIR